MFILLLAAVIGLIAYQLTRTRPLSKRRDRRHDDETAALRWVLRHPQQAAIVAAVLGFCSGAMPEARDALRDLIKDPD